MPEQKNLSSATAIAVRSSLPHSASVPGKYRIVQLGLSRSSSGSGGRREMCDRARQTLSVTRAHMHTDQRMWVSTVAYLKRPLYVRSTVSTSPNLNLTLIINV